MIELLGWVGGGLVLLSLIQRSHARLHSLNILACTVFLVYDTLMKLPSMFAMNVALLAVSARQLLHLRRVDGRRPDNRAQPDGAGVPDPQKTERATGLLRSCDGAHQIASR